MNYLIILLQAPPTTDSSINYSGIIFIVMRLLIYMIKNDRHYKTSIKRIKELFDYHEKEFMEFFFISCCQQFFFLCGKCKNKKRALQSIL